MGSSRRRIALGFGAAGAGLLLGVGARVPRRWGWGCGLAARALLGPQER
jgi:hypothetical protein